MADAWADYDEYKTDSALSERYYAFVTRCFEQGIRSVLGSRRAGAALDVACGAGDSTAVLINYAERVEGIDLSAALIDKARASPQLKAVEFHHGDFLDHPLGRRYDLITAAWLHNFIHSEQDQQRVLHKVAGALHEGGAVVFLFPSESFTTDRTGRYVARLTWRQAWYECADRYTRGVFSFRDSPWQVMTCWQPLYLLEPRQRALRSAVRGHQEAVRRRRLPGRAVSEPHVRGNVRAQAGKRGARLNRSRRRRWPLRPAIGRCGPGLDHLWLGPAPGVGGPTPLYGPRPGRCMIRDGFRGSRSGSPRMPMQIASRGAACRWRGTPS